MIDVKLLAMFNTKQIKSSLIFAGLMFFAAGLTAQHCPFDATGIIVVNTHSSASSTNIPDLKITLIDSLGKPVGEFWRNPDKTTFHGPIDCNHRAEVTKMRFPFAKDNYVFVGVIDLLNMSHTIIIEDTDGPANGGNFKTLVINPESKGMYSLCGTYKMEEYPEDYRERKVFYKPIEVCLTAE
jgi:hypothetical protein